MLKAKRKLFERKGSSSQERERNSASCPPLDFFDKLHHESPSSITKYHPLLSSD